MHKKLAQRSSVLRHHLNRLSLPQFNSTNSYFSQTSTRPSSSSFQHSNASNRFNTTIPKYNYYSTSSVEDSASLQMNKNTQAKQAPKFTNRLAHEKSPYLLQHQHNPVDWYPWGNEAFEKAKKEDKLIFLSVGYYACHWCHEMEHESFENVQIAKLMNDHFVNVKVDREERPDVDRVYMTYVQATTGHGGWPMSVFLTSDLKPVFGGTYFPPFSHSSGGMMIGFATLLQRLHHLWQNDRKKLLDSANHVMEALRDAEVTESISHFETAGGDAVAQDTMKLYNEQLLKHGNQYLEKCTKYFLHEFDHVHGGFGAAPKFPRPVIFNFLFHMYHRYHNAQAQQQQQQQQQQQAQVQQQANNQIEEAEDDGDSRMSSQILHACLHTLNQMAQGGMYDTLGFGFHRYSVDTQWHVPHFEKMLYDQAQLVHSYLDATQITCYGIANSTTANSVSQEQSLYAKIAHQVLQYVMRDLRDLQTGAFYTAEDADSIDPHNTVEKREGAFYVWTFEELQQVLLGSSSTLSESTKSGHIFTPVEVAKFVNYYSCLAQGNVPDAQDTHGEFVNQNILHVKYDNPEQQASKSGSSSSSSVGSTAAKADEEQPYFEEMRKLLLDYRNKTRARPSLDDKVITSWNGIMIGAFARASRVLNIQQNLQIQQGNLLQAADNSSSSGCGNTSVYLKVAIDACESLLQTVWDGNKRILYRASRHGQVNTNIPGFLSDYACVISGLLDLYEASGNHKYAQLALEIQQAQDEIFLDKKLNHGATYYETSGNDPSILLRQKETYDGAEAAGNSISCMNLLRLSTLYDLDEYRNIAIRTLASFHKQISKIPYASPQLMCALDVLVGHQKSLNATAGGYMKKVVLVTDGLTQQEANNYNAIHVLSQVHEPNAVILHLNNKESREYWTQRLPYLKDLQMKDGKPTALLCMNKTCQLPTNDLAKVFVAK